MWIYLTCMFVCLHVLFSTPRVIFCITMPFCIHRIELLFSLKTLSSYFKTPNVFEIFASVLYYIFMAQDDVALELFHIFIKLLLLNCVSLLLLLVRF